MEFESIKKQKVKRKERNKQNQNVKSNKTGLTQIKRKGTTN
jgi:hypothetical protein